jgi:anti-anti-sigma factor
MIECNISKGSGFTWVHLNGRIDSLNSSEVQQQFTKVIKSGELLIAANLEKVSYLSSAGLRVFLMVQKQLQKAGGEIIIYKISGSAFEVFKMSGFDNLFRIVFSKGEIEKILADNGASSEVESLIVDGMAIQISENKTSPGLLKIIGSHDKLLTSQYTESDVSSVKASELQFGLGFAAPGGTDSEYMNFLGESVVLDRNFFYYPAVKRTAVDFILNSGKDSGLKYKFLHGFSFKGEFSHLISFDYIDGFIELSSLVESIFRLSQANLLGIVLLAESKGFWGMNLKKIPVKENSPSNGGEIFDADCFSDWVNFPVEPGDTDSIIAGVGLGVRNPEKESRAIQGLLAKGSNFHFHASVFSGSLLSRNISQFRAELARVVNDLETIKVQHVMGKSLFSSGMIGVIELE